MKNSTINQSMLVIKNGWQKWNSLLPYYLVILWSSIVFTTVNAQTPMFYNYNTGGTNNSFPFSTSDKRIQFLYAPGEFPGATSGRISKIYFRTNTAFTNATYTNFSIKLSQTVGSALSFGPAGALPYVTPLTTCLSAPTYVIPTGVIGGWVGFTLTTPFPYDPTQSLVVEIIQTVVVSGGWQVLNTGSTGNNRRIYGASAAITGTADAGYGHLGIDITPNSYNDAGIISIDSPAVFCGGTRNIVARIKNFGSNQITSASVNWSLNGTLQTPVSFSGLLDTSGGAGSNQAQVLLGAVSFPAGSPSLIKAWTSLPNGVTDTMPLNDSVAVNKQPALSGTFTVGTGGAYPTVTSAVASLQNGVAGNVLFELLPAYTSSGETFPINVPDYTKVNCVSNTPLTITLRPQSGASNLQIMGSAVQLFNVNGADNFIIDGRAGGTGITRNLSLINTLTTGTALTYSNDAIGGKILYCNIRTSITTAASGAILISGSTGAIGNDSITIANCYFSRTAAGNYANGIYSLGTSASVQNNNIDILNNEFNGFTTNGIAAPTTNSGNGSYWNVSGNSFYDTSTANTYVTPWTAINLTPTGGAANYYTISNNYIGGQAAQCGGGPLTNATAVAYVGITLTTAAGPANTIYGNTIQNFYLPSTTNTLTFNGINVTAGAVNIDSNTIGSLSTASSIVSFNSAALVGINATPTTVNINVTRNNIANIYVNNPTSTAAAVRGMNIGGSAITTVSNNTIKALKVNSAMVGTTTTSSVAGLICSASGTTNITNNNIGNGLAEALRNANSATAAVRVTGMYVSSGTNTISGNNVNGLSLDSTATTTVGTTTSANMLGIAVASSLAGQVISNNTVQHLYQSSTAAAQTTQMNGILYASSGSNTISGNTVYGIYSRSTYTGTSTSSAVNAIINSSSGQSTIVNNYIDSIAVNTPTAAATTINGIIISGTTGNSTTGNVIKSIYTNSTTTYSINGIYHISAVINQTMDNNRVYNLVNVNPSSAVSIAGIRFAASAALTNNTNVVSRNFVHSLKLNTSAAGTIIGIENTSGFSTFRNNMVRLGIDSAGSAFTGPYVIYGMHDLYSSTTVPSFFYHNSVYISGSPTSGSSLTAAMYLPVAGKMANYRSNIFFNNVANNGGTGFNCALRVNNTTNLNSNYNILYAPNPGSCVASTSALNYVTLTGIAGWIAASRQDAQSEMVNPAFITPNGTSSTVDLRLQSSNPAEGGGDPTIFSLVTNDFDNISRSSLTPDDIGANAGNFTLTYDSIAPGITYTALTNTGSVTNRTFTATITDNKRLDTSLLYRPRVYYRKSTSGSWMSTAGTLLSGTTRNSNWSFTIDYSLVGFPLPTDTIQYFVIAQDSALNISSNPVYTVATDVYNVASYPALNQYIISSPLPTSITVGPTGDYLTLTGAGGAFSAINNGILQGNTTIYLQPGTITETGTNMLGQWLEINGSNVMGNYYYTLTIRPQTNSQVVLTGTGPTTGLIGLNGADRVIFLGYDQFGTINDTNLIIRNTTTSGPALGLQNDASGNSFNNVIFESVYGTGIVNISSASLVTGNDNLTFDNCAFRSSSLPTLPSYAFYSTGTAGRENDSLLINNCQFYNFNSYGVYLNGGGGSLIRIKNSHFYQPLSTSSNIYTIYFAPGTLSNNDTISGNYIGGTMPFAGGSPMINNYTSQFLQVYVASAGSLTGVSITNNVIRNINFISSAYGYFIYSGSGAANISNNTLGDTATANSITFSTTCGSTVYGLMAASGVASKINNNIVSNISNAGIYAIYSIYNSSGATQINNNLVSNLTNTNLAGTSVQLVGIYSGSASISQINNNTIKNFQCNSGYTGTTTSSAVMGIINASATTVNISNNIIRNLRDTNSTITHSMYGIITSSGLAVINGNLVEDLFTASNYTGTTTTAHLAGIYNSSSTAGQTLTNNIVRNLSSYNPVPASTQTIGILMSAGGSHTITGNTVSSIRSNSISTGTTTSSAIIGMYIASSASQMNVSQNNITTLEDTTYSATTVNLIGMYYSNSITTGSNLINANQINSLKLNTSGIGTMHGLYIGSSYIGVFSNNMIRLGLDSSGTPSGGPYILNGIITASSNANGFFHNSIYIGGAPASGNSNTHAFQMSVTATVQNEIKNNIFYNAVSNSSSAGLNYAIKLNSVSNINSNNNILFTPGNGGRVGAITTTSYTTLTGATSWNLATGLDYFSGYGDPLFTNPNAASPIFDLHLQTTNPGEGMGDPTVNINVPADFDGNTRSSLTPSDIGAHAGNFILATDIFVPRITFSPLSNSGDFTGPVTFSGVNITDAKGIYTTGFNAPTLYYQKGVAGTYASVIPTTFSGTSRNATFSYNIDYSLIGGVTANDTIRYYVIAQDSAGNIISNAGYAVATLVSSVTSAPVNPNSYLLLPAIPTGTKFYVGAGKTYTSFTGSGGLFSFLNNSTLAGNITAVVTSDITETGAVSLNQLGETGLGAGNFTFTIRPDSSATGERLLSGNSATALFLLNGADRVKMTGVPDLSANATLMRLRIRNSNSGSPSIQFNNGAQGCRLNNLTIEGANTSTAVVGGGVIAFANPSSVNGNSFDSITNCLIRNDITQTQPAGVPAIAIQSGSSSFTVMNSDNFISGNSIQNFGAYGINTETGSGNNWLILNNSLFNDLTTPPAGFGLTITSIRINGNYNSNGDIISGNYVGGQSINAGGLPWTNNLVLGFQGIMYNGGNNAAGTIQNNVIRNINLTSFSTTAQFAAINHSGGWVNIGSSGNGNTIGDPLNINSITLAGAVTHFGITTGTGVASVPLTYAYNNIQGIFINSPGNAAGFNGIAINGGIPVVNNNTIGHATTASSIRLNGNGLLRGMVITNTVGVAATSTISNNTIANLDAMGNQSSVAVNGINFTGSSIAGISGNSIYNLSTNSGNVTSGPGNLLAATGIVHSGAANAGTVISQNQIYNIAVNNTSTALTNAAAISVTGLVQLNIFRNRIYDIKNLSTATGFNPMATASGILAGSFINNVNMTNNQITLGTGLTNNVQLNGIWQYTSGSFDVNSYYNTVVITGSVTSGNLPSYAYHRGSNSATEISSRPTLVNNVFINNRSGGTTKNYAIANEMLGTPVGSGWGVNVINYNLLGSSSSSTIGLWGTVDKDIDSWRVSSAKDYNSWSTQTGVVAGQLNPLSLYPNISTGNLAPDNTNPVCWYINGKGVAGSTSNNINTDYNGNPRGVIYGYGTDIGAAEFNTTTTPPAATISGSITGGGTSVISFAGRTLASVNWGSGTLPSSISATYYSAVHPNVTIGRNYMSSYLNIAATGGSGYNYGITLNYEPALIGNVTSESNLIIAKYNSPAWNIGFTSAVNTTAKTISTSNGALGSFSDFVGTDVTNPLPVTMLSFNARKTAEAVVLSWNTASEINNNGFGIERSTDGNIFDKIGFVKAGSNSHTTSSYNYLDNDISQLSGIVYYRLKQIDFDGVYNYSNTALVNMDRISPSTSISVYPNPFDLVTPTLSINCKESVSATISVYDITGRTAGIISQQLLKGNNKISLEMLNNQHEGIYFLQVNINGELFNRRLIKE